MPALSIDSRADCALSYDSSATLKIRNPATSLIKYSSMIPRHIRLASADKCPGARCNFITSHF